MSAPAIAPNDTLYSIGDEYSRIDTADRLNLLISVDHLHEEGYTVPVFIFEDAASISSDSAEFGASLDLQIVKMAAPYDLVIVGGGPAGFQVAHQAASQGMRVLLLGREVVSSGYRSPAM